jgi:DNA-binding NarL/FixJ family response regulator
VGRASALALDGDQQRLLQGVASGAAIVDLAEEFGYSRSSMYRELSKLWRALGVSDRAHAIRKAAEEGLLD